MAALTRREFLKISGAGIAGATILGVAGCGAQGGTGGDGPIRIGVAIPLSDALATEGEITKEGYDVWANKVNEQGGIEVGGALQSVELTYYDDQSDPQTGTRLVQRLVSQDDIKLLLSGYGTENIMAESIAAQRAGAIMINGGGGSATLYETGNEQFFGVVPLAEDLYTGLIELLGTLPAGERPKTAAYAYSNETFTTQLVEGARPRAEELGIETVFDESWPAGSRDLSGILTQAKSADPDVLITGTHVGDGIQIVQSLEEINFAPKLVGVATAIPTPDYDEALGETGWYAVGPAYWAQELPQEDLLWGSRANFVKEYTEQTGQETIDYHVPMAASAGEVLQYGIQESGSVDPGEIAQALHDAEGIDTLFGTLSFTETGLAQGLSLVQLQRYDDKVNVVWPEEDADQFVYPMPSWSER